MKQLAFLDLFSGIGGFALGAAWSGLPIGYHFFSDTNDFTNHIYQQHFPEAYPLGDITKVSTQTLKKHIEEAGGDFHQTEWIIAGGFPCQDLSIAGKRAGIEGKRSGLWTEMHRLITELRPRWVCAENVSNLIRLGYDRVASDLEESGYTTGAICIPACATGAPHRRERIWIIAHPNESATPALTTSHSKESGIPQKHRQKNRSTGYTGRTTGRVCHNEATSSFTADTASVRQPTRRSEHDISLEGAKSKLSVLELNSRTASPRGINTTTNTSSKPKRRHSNQASAITTLRQTRVVTPDQDVAHFERKWWELEIEPLICRVDDGVPEELDGSKGRLSAHQATPNATS